MSQALPRTDLKDIHPPGYIRLLLQLSKSGADIGPLAGPYLTYPKVDAFVPEHSIKPDRLEGATLLYGSMEPALADKYLIAALEDKQPYARSTALQLPAISMTEDAFRALKSHQAALPALTASEKAEVDRTLKYSETKIPA